MKSRQRNSLLILKELPRMLEQFRLILKERLGELLLRFYELLENLPSDIRGRLEEFPPMLEEPSLRLEEIPLILEYLCEEPPFMLSELLEDVPLLWEEFSGVPSNIRGATSSIREVFLI